MICPSSSCSRNTGWQFGMRVKSVLLRVSTIDLFKAVTLGQHSGPWGLCSHRTRGSAIGRGTPVRTLLRLIYLGQLDNLY